MASDSGAAAVQTGDVFQKKKVVRIMPEPRATYDCAFRAVVTREDAGGLKAGSKRAHQ